MRSGPGKFPHQFSRSGTLVSREEEDERGLSGPQCELTQFNETADTSSKAKVELLFKMKHKSKQSADIKMKEGSCVIT